MSSFFPARTKLKSPLSLPLFWAVLLVSGLLLAGHGHIALWVKQVLLALVIAGSAVVFHRQLAPQQRMLDLINARLYEAALEACTREMERFPNNNELRVQLATIYMGLNRPAEALAITQDVISGNPDHIFARINHATALVDLHRYDEALDGYEAALALAQQRKLAESEWYRSVVILNRGICYLHKGELDKALHDFEHAVRDSNTMFASRLRAVALNYRAFAYALMDEWERAIADVKAAQRAKRHNSHREINACVQALINLHNGKTQDALAQLDAAVAFNPRHRELHWLRHLAFLQAGEIENARQEREKALELGYEPYYSLRFLTADGSKPGSDSAD